MGAINYDFSSILKWVLKFASSLMHNTISFTLCIANVVSRNIVIVS
jgi:hypothetical protein